MILNLIGSVLIFAILLIFVALNAQGNNSCDINFGFTLFKAVPIFISVFISFLAGMVFAFPLMFVMRIKKSMKKKEQEKQKLQAAAAETGSAGDNAQRKK